MSRSTPPSCKIRNWPASTEALKRLGSLTAWLDPEMIWDALPTGQPGRQKTLAVNFPYRGEKGPLHLFSQIPAPEKIATVTAEGAYDTRKYHDAIADRGAHAGVPPRKNAKP